MYKILYFKTAFINDQGIKREITRKISKYIKQNHQGNITSQNRVQRVGHDLVTEHQHIRNEEMFEINYISFHL